MKTELTTALKAPINDWFAYRYISSYDEERFRFYFQREVELYGDQFLKLLNAQLKSLDPEITRKLHEISHETGNENETGSQSATDTKNSTLTSDHTSDYTSDVHENTSDTSNTDTNANEDTTSNAYNRQLFSSTPQSMVNASTTGNPDDISWEYATSLTDNITKGNGSNVSGSSTDSNGESETNRDQTDKTKLKGTDTRVETDNTVGNHENDKDHEVNRESTITETGEALQDLYLRYYTYVKESNAFLWILKYVDKVFLSTFMEDEYGTDS